MVKTPENKLDVKKDGEKPIADAQDTDVGTAKKKSVPPQSAADSQTALEVKAADANGEKSFAEVVKESQAPVMLTIYDKINELFGAGNQLFCMEFPTRGLNQKDYEYSIEDCYGVVSKPYPVQEAEFALSDQMFDAAPIVQGSNGERVSTAYSALVNNYVPKLKSLKQFVLDQKNLRAWLLHKIEDELDKKPVQMSRMGFAKELYIRFLKERNEWYKEKNDKYNALKKEKNLEEYTRWLSAEGLVREEEINTFYNDAIVRGFYHEVLTILGYLNISSPSELLESTKQKMRSSLRRSLDGSFDVYPVTLQPSDWFKALKPNVSPKDLLSSKEVLLQEFQNKSKKILQLKSQIEVLPAAPSAEYLKSLEDNLTKANKEYNESQLAMAAQFNASAVSAFKAVLDIYKNFPRARKAEMFAKLFIQSESERTAEEKAAREQIVNMFGEVAESVAAQMNEMYSKQIDLLEKVEKYADLQREHALTKVGDFEFQRKKLNSEIIVLENDLAYLKPLLTGMGAYLAGGEADPAAGTSMLSDKDNLDDFMDIVLTSESVMKMHSSTQSAETTTKSWRTGFWFWSANHNSTESSSSYAIEDKSSSNKVSIAFRAKKVSIERGGWFNPTLLKLTDNFYNLAGNIKSNNGTTKSAAQDNFRDNLPSADTGLFKAFTTGFILVKDVTFKIDVSNTSNEEVNDYMKSVSTGGGGFFGFSANSNSSAEKSSSKSFSSCTDSGVYIRIPGPQIIGWLQEFTPKDNSSVYEALDPHIFEDGEGVKQNSEEESILSKLIE